MFGFFNWFMNFGIFLFFICFLICSVTLFLINFFLKLEENNDEKQEDEENRSK